MVVVTVLALAFAGYAGVTALTREPHSDYVSNPALENIVPPPAVSSTAPAVDLSRVRTALFLGDSWTYGVGADEPTQQGFAYDAARTLGLDATVRGYGSVGWLDRGADGTGTILDRWNLDPRNADVPDLVVLQGSLNDSEERANDVGQAATDAIAALRGKYPNSQFVWVGPAPASENWERGLSAIDYEIAQSMAEANVPYISPLKRRWLSVSNYADTIADDQVHPTTAGHAFFAAKLVETLNGTAAK